MSAILSDPFLQMRPMHVDDLANVMQTERAAYEHPWTEGIFRDCLRVGYCCWVCELERSPIGHAVMSVAVGEAHILNVCVAPEWQGKGLGRRLLERLLRIAVQHHADTAYLEVRVSNQSARNLYESSGFGEIGVRRDYYPAHPAREDAAVYARVLNLPPRE